MDEFSHVRKQFFSFTFILDIRAIFGTHALITFFTVKIIFLAIPASLEPFLSRF